MKKTILTIISTLIFFAGFGQRYEVWVGTSEVNKAKGNYGFSNDTVLMIYSNPSLIFPSKDTYFSWDDVDKKKYRNKSKNQLGQIAGTVAGMLALGLANNSFKKSTDEGLGMFMTVVAPVCILSGTLIGHLATNKKRDLQLDGLNHEIKINYWKNLLKENNNSFKINLSWELFC